MTTKSSGNFVEVTLGGGNDGSGRELHLLSDEQCFATINMSDAELAKDETELLSGTGLYWATLGHTHPQTETGQVQYIGGHLVEHQINLRSFSFDPESWDFVWPQVPSFWNGLDQLQEDSDPTCNIYTEVSCLVGPDKVPCSLFMVCCGSITDAYFGTGNCCLQPSYAGHPTASPIQDPGRELDERRLGKCSQ